MADLTWFDSRHAIYASHETSWKREERRLYGGDAVLEELIQFSHEEDDTFTARKSWARWTGFGRVHTTVLSGHLTSKIPRPNFGALGDVRELGEAQGQQSLAELFFYNADGVGTDGQQLPAFMDGVEQRALATGFRWLMVEMPTRDTLAQIRLRLVRDEAANVTDEEVRAGFRPFLVEYSPLAVTNWRIRDGVLCWAVVRIPVEPEMDFGNVIVPGLGYYLLVRQGYEGLGPEFTSGGWWKYDGQKTLTSQGTWSDTGGQIPMWIHQGEPGRGTYERPSIGQSSTMELGQISADMMNAVSEQRYNARQAAKSINYILGTNPLAQGKVVEQEDAGSITVGVPVASDGQGGVVVPAMWNSSEGALATEVYKTIIEAAVSEAKEIMVRQILAAPDASGARVEAEHASATSPMLARIAGTAETSWNTGLYFTGRRFGLSHEQASALSVAIPRDFELRNVLDSIDTMLDTMTKAGVASRTFSAALVARKADELDLMPEDRVVVEEELAAGDVADLERSKLQAEVVKAWLDAEATLAGAATEAGLSPERVVSIFGSANPETPTPQSVPVPGQPPQPPAQPTPADAVPAAA